MSIRYLQGLTFIGCDTGALPGCGQPATILIVAEEEIWHAGDVQETLTVVTAACAEHAPGEAHEAASSRSGDEYVVIPITPVGTP